MCLIVFAWQQHAQMPLLLAANRDEFHARPTAPAGFWTDEPDILAGRDLQAGGTWLGVSRSGRFAAITNIRDPRGGNPSLRSRGELSRDFLAGRQNPKEYLQALETRIGDYQGFNLLVGDSESLWYLHGARPTAGPQALAPGIYGLSNAALDVPWPKVTLAKRALREALTRDTAPPTAAALGNCLADRSLADADDLAGQGLQGEMARRLSAQFIVTADYGTRCKTILRCTRQGIWEFAETRFDARGDSTGTSEFSLRIEPPAGDKAGNP